MVLPLRLSSALVLAALACAPAGSTEPPDAQTDEGEAGEGSVVAPVEAEGASSEGSDTDEAPSELEHFEHEGVSVDLSPGRCDLLVEAGGARLEHHFAFPADCHLARTADGQVRAVVTDTGLALMIESSKALEQDCDTALRVLVLTAEGPRLSRGMQRVAMCTEAAGGSPGQWDEMMFHVLASDPVPLGTPAEDS